MDRTEGRKRAATRAERYGRFVPMKTTVSRTSVCRTFGERLFRERFEDVGEMLRPTVSAYFSTTITAIALIFVRRTLVRHAKRVIDEGLGAEDLWKIRNRVSNRHVRSDE